jgi:hypothetical protein
MSRAEGRRGSVVPPALWIFVSHELIRCLPIALAGLGASLSSLWAGRLCSVRSWNKRLKFTWIVAFSQRTHFVCWSEDRVALQRWRCSMFHRNVGVWSQNYRVSLLWSLLIIGVKSQKFICLDTSGRSECLFAVLQSHASCGMNAEKCCTERYGTVFITALLVVVAL